MSNIISLYLEQVNKKRFPKCNGKDYVDIIFVAGKGIQKERWWGGMGDTEKIE